MFDKIKKKQIPKFVFIILILIQLFVGIFGINQRGISWVCAFAEEVAISKTGEEELGESVKDILDGLDLQALEEYVEKLDFLQGESLTDRLLAYIQGEEVDYEGLGKKISEVLFEKVVEILPAFACIAAITLLAGLIATLRVGANSNTSADMIYLISYASTLIPLISVLTEIFEISLESISQMQTQMQIVFPIMLTLMAASGETLTVAVCKPAVAFFTNSIVSVIYSVVFPITVTVIAFSMASNLTKELKISKFGGFFKSINKWLIGVCISVFGLFFTLQGLTAATRDGIVRRAAKYAIGTGIPIVGGFLSGGFDLAVAGSVLIKNSLGSMSIFLMASVLFEPLLLLIAVNLLLRFTSAITQPFGDSRISDFLGETADNLNYCTAGLLFTAFMYFLSIVILVSATEALF